MAQYLPPTENLPIFDTSVFNINDTGLTLSEANSLFLRYPIAQGTETLQAVNVNGAAIFNNDVSFDYLNTPPHCSIPPINSNDLCNKAYVDSQAPLTAFQLFCNYSQTYTTPTPTTYKLLSDAEVFTPTVLPFTISTIGTQYITGFFNSISTLNIGSNIPPGNWTFNCYANVSAIGDQSHIGLSYSIIGVSSLGVETILYTSASSNLITVVSPSVGIYPMTITVPSTSISTYTVIGVKLYITSNTNATRNGNIYFQETSYYTNVLTSFSVLAPANIVNSNNVWTGTNSFNNQLSMGASGFNTFNMAGTSGNINASSGNMTIRTLNVSAIGINGSQIVSFTNPPSMSGASISAGTIPTTSVIGIACDLTTSQTIGGTKTFSSPPVMSGASITNGTIPITSIVGTACDITTSQTIGGTKTFSNAPTMSGTGISGGIPITSVVGTACDLSTSQTVGGTKTFSIAPIMSGSSITSNTIPITSIVGTAVDCTTTQSIVSGDKTFFSKIILQGTVALNLGTTLQTAGNNSSRILQQGINMAFQNNAFSSSTNFGATSAGGSLANCLTLSSALNAMLATNNTAPTASPGNNTTTIATTAFVTTAVSGTVGTATNVNVIDRSATTGAFNIGILQGVTGALPVGACTALTYNNTSGLLSVPQTLIGTAINSAGNSSTYSKFTGVRNDIINNATAGSFKFFNCDGSNNSINTLTLSTALNTLSAVNNTAPTASPGDNTTTIATTAFVTNAVSGGGGNASTITLANTASGATNYLVMSTTNTGASSLLTDNSGATYNSTTNTAVISITGNSATTTSATNVFVNSGSSTPGYILFTNGIGGTEAVKANSSFNYNTGSALLTAPNITASTSFISPIVQNVNSGSSGLTIRNQASNTGNMNIQQLGTGSMTFSTAGITNLTLSNGYTTFENAIRYATNLTALSGTADLSLLGYAINEFYTVNSTSPVTIILPAPASAYGNKITFRRSVGSAVITFTTDQSGGAAAEIVPTSSVTAAVTATMTTLIFTSTFYCNATYWYQASY